MRRCSFGPETVGVPRTPFQPGSSREILRLGIEQQENRIAAQGGSLRLEDLASYRVRDRVPVRGSYRGHEIVAPPPPASSGVHIVQMLNILEGYDLAAMPHGSPARLHLIAEVLKIAFADRAAATADPEARLASTRTYQYSHPLGCIIGALFKAGLKLEFLNEHAAIPWRMFAQLVQGDDGLFRWPDKQWLPLAVSLMARRPSGPA